MHLGARPVSRLIPLTRPHPSQGTSLTTAAAFFANAVSHITCVRCFGIFAGLVVLCDYVLMISWLPAVVVLHHRHRWLRLPPAARCMPVCVHAMCASEASKRAPTPTGAPPKPRNKCLAHRMLYTHLTRTPQSTVPFVFFVVLA